MTSISSLLPEHEQRFLANAAAEVLQEGVDLEGIISRVAKVFSDREYGWEEAVLDRTWFRYPSEVKRMRFCSEEALKNFLLLEVLGLEPEWASTTNYYDTGLAHEFAMVENGGKYYLLDWGKVFPVALNGSQIAGHPGIGDFEKIPREDVLERVESLRDGSAFLEALECGQNIYRKNVDGWEVEARVWHKRSTLEIDFVTTFTPLYTGAPYYVRQRTSAVRGADYALFELGIVDWSGHGKDRYKYLVRHETDSSGQHSDINLAFEGMGDEARRGAIHQTAFELIAPQNGCMTPGHVRASYLKRWRRLAQSEARTSPYFKALVEGYGKLRETDPAGAERLLEFNLFNLGAFRMDEAEFLREMEMHHGLSPDLFGMYSAITVVNTAAPRVRQDALYRAHNILIEELGRQIGHPLPPINTQWLDTALTEGVIEIIE